MNEQLRKSADEVLEIARIQRANQVAQYPVKLVGCRNIAWRDGFCGEWCALYQVYNADKHIGHITVTIEHAGRNITREDIDADNEDVVEFLWAHQSGILEENPQEWCPVGNEDGKFDNTIADRCTFNCREGI